MNKVTKVKVVKTPVKPVKPKYYRNAHSFDEYETIEELIKDADINDNESLSIRIRNLKNTIVNTINFSVSVLEHCCAISEIGSLRLSTGIKEEDLISLFDTLSKSTTGHTYMINTNGLGASLQCEKALIKCKQWTLVKTFKNSNSNNTIKIWMSNNY